MPPVFVTQAPANTSKPMQRVLVKIAGACEQRVALQRSRNGAIGSTLPLNDKYVTAVIVNL